MDWAYQDSWAYKVDGVWTTGGNSCTDDSDTTCESDCPYPFVECSTSSSGCSFSLQIRDTYGDTWNGNTIDFLVNGTSVGNYTQDGSGTDWLTVSTADVSFGDVVSASYNYSGTYPGENEWRIVDADGTVVSTGNYYDGNGKPVCT